MREHLSSLRFIATIIISSLLFTSGCLTTDNSRASLNPLSLIPIEDGSIAADNPTTVLYVNLMNKLKEQPQMSNLVTARIESNIERMKKYGIPQDDKFMEVNIPSFTLTLFEKDHIHYTHKVIVGKKHCPTPILKSEVTRIELNPYWEVPPSIASNEILPKLQNDADYLKNNHMEVFDLKNTKLTPSEIDWKKVSSKDFKYHIHQKPGPGNAMGPIKFVFKNNHGVYLHGTPNAALFDEPFRCMSHGCIRVENPLAVAEFAMKGSEWTKEKIENALLSGQRLNLSLPKPLPIYLSYWTTLVNETGELVLLDDIYDYDRK